MKRVDIGMRPKRFKVLNHGSVEIIIEMASGAKLSGKVTDASMKGIAAVFSLTDVEQHLSESIDIGEILPESKLRWDDRECPLGRVTLIRKSQPSDLGVIVAMSCIDTKIPLTGNLAKHFAEIDRGAANPLEFELNAPKYSLANFAEADFQHPDLFERCRQYQVLLNESRKNPLFQYYSVKESDEGSRSRFKMVASRKRIDAVSFASYDYLGLYKHPAVVQAAKSAIDTFGVSAAGTMILAGKTKLHEKLEYEISRWFGKEDALIFSSGFAANLGTISGLLRTNDLVVADIFSHASLMDGIAASQATARFYRHNDLKSLDQSLTKMRNDYNGTMIITEGLFSMEGTTPNMKEIIKIGKKHNARVFIDECHSVGIFGPRGLGVCDRDGVLEEVDVFMGSFSKGLGVGAIGFITGSKELIEWLRFFARAGMFSAAIPPSCAGAALEVVNILQEDDSHLKKLQANIDRFRTGLADMGIETPAESGSPIIPIIVEDENTLGKLNQELLENGVYVNCILFPAVPVGQARFRFSLTAHHSASDIDLALNALKLAFSKYGQNGEKPVLKLAS